MQSNIKILIVGKTGHGKSTLANAFLGKSGVFMESANLTS
jgi:predicted GTPase